MPSVSAVLQVPTIDLGSVGFRVENYPNSESDDENGPLTALRLYPTLVTRPGDHVGLGSEVAQSGPMAFQHFIINPDMSIIVPAHTPEIVDIGQRQFYKLPATHRTTGSPLYLCAPIEVGTPEAIFASFPMFIPLQPASLPDDCNWLSPHSSH